MPPGHTPRPPLRVGAEAESHGTALTNTRPPALIVARLLLSEDIHSSRGIPSELVYSLHLTYPTDTTTIMINQRAFLALLLFALVILAISNLPTAQAFGAGNVPSYSAMEGKAFRHGDFADTLRQLVKKGSKGIFSSGSKFSGLDVSRIYAANFWTDYSQAMDVAALEKMPKQTILTIVMVLSFLSLGYATEEFEVTDERLGVYLCHAHIDNPKGYGDGKNPRQLDPRLRGPVDPRELEIDPRSGMKNYIANESGGWDTSSKYIRDNLIQCIELGRRARSSGDKATLYEAYRFLGRAMHTSEDVSV